MADREDQQLLQQTTDNVPYACAVIALGTIAIVAGFSIGHGGTAAVLTAIGIPAVFVGFMELIGSLA